MIHRYLQRADQAEQASLRAKNSAERLAFDEIARIWRELAAQEAADAEADAAVAGEGEA